MNNILRSGVTEPDITPVANPPNNPSFPHLILAGLLLGGALTAPAQTISWDGGGNGFSWTDPLNWSLDRLPNDNDDVAIHAGPGVTVTLGAPGGLYVVKSLQCSSPFVVANGTLKLNQGASEISGPWAITGGVLASELAGSTLVLSGPATTINGTLVASGGAVVQATGLKSLMAEGNGLLRAIGPDARLDLTSLTNLAVPDGLFFQVQAMDGGRVDLSALARSTGALWLTGTGTGAQLDMSGLAGHWTGDNGALGVAVFAENGGSVLIPKVTSMDRAQLQVANNGTITTAQLTGMGSLRAVAINASLNLSNLTSLTLSQSADWVVAGPGVVLDLSGLTNLTVSGASRRLTLEAQGGARVDLSRVQRVSGGVTMRTYDAGTILDLSSLGGRWSGQGFGGLVLDARSGSTFLLPALEELAFAQVSAQGGATMNLAGLRDAGAVSLLANGATLRLTNITSMVVSNYNPIWQAIGANALLDLSRLASLTVNSDLQVQAQAVNGGRLDLSRLGASQGSLNLNSSGAGSVLDLSGLAGHWTGGGSLVSALAVNNGSILMPGVTSMDRGTLQVDNGGTITTRQFTRLDDVRLTLQNASLNLSNLTSLVVSNDTEWLVSGPGQVLDLSGVTNLTVVRPQHRFVLQAHQGGRLDLRRLRTATGSVTVQTLNPGSVADLASLGPRWSGAQGISGILVQAQGASSILLPNLEELDHGRLVVNSGGTIVVDRLRAAGAASFLAENATLRLTNLVSLVVSNFNPVWQAVGAGALLDLSRLNRLTVAPGWLVQPQALNGGRVDLSGLPSLFTGAVQVTAGGPGSVVDLSRLSGFVNLYPNPISRLDEQNGGVILLPPDALLLSNIEMNLAGHPVLPPSMTANRALTLYGRAWHSYRVESRPIDDPAAPWALYRRVPLTNNAQVLAATVPPGREFRVEEFVADPPLVELNRIQGGDLQLTLFGAPGRTYQLESGAELPPPAGWQAGPTAAMTNSFRIFPAAPPAGPHRFHRARQIGP